MQSLSKSGNLPQWLVDKLRNVVQNATIEDISNAHVAGAVIAPVSDRELAKLNQHHSYRLLDEQTKIVVRAILEHLKITVTDFLDSAWTVLNVRSWTTKMGASMGPNKWHLDQDDPRVLKLMIYGTPTGGKYGGLEFEGGKLNGESWILFYSSLLQHCAIAPTEEGIERVATEVTLCRSSKYSLEPKFLGFTARYPENTEFL
jgi:hypothetical protein